MRIGIGTIADFDVSDVDQEMHRVRFLERTCRFLRERRARAFAQGFVAGSEEASSEWVAEFKEKSA